MRVHWQRRKRQVSHADDWLMTYADMITLLLCFFAIFLCVSLSKHGAKKIDMPISVALNAPQAPAVTGPFHPVTEADLAPDVPLIPAPPALRDDTEDSPQDRGARAASSAEVVPPVTVALSTAADADTAAASPVAAQASVEVPVKPEPHLVPPIAPAPSDVGPKGDRITMMEMSSETFFGRGSANLSEAGKAVLRDVAAKIQSGSFKDYQVTVEGHTDDVPIKTVQFPSNWELSTARASAVVHFFLDQGISAQRLRAAGYADSFPKVPNRSAEGTPLPSNQAVNRRVVIKLEKIDREG